MTNLLRLRRALQWYDAPGTVTFLELALDFEEFAGCMLPAAPQAKWTGHTLSLHERARVLRLALATLQKLVKTRVWYPVANMTKCAALITLGGLALCGLNRRPYFACRRQMITHGSMLAHYCESTWATSSHTRACAQTVRIFRTQNG